MPEFKELEKIVDRVGRENKLSPDQAFTVWYLMCFGTPKEQAIKALTGRGKEQGMDAILIDDAKKQILVIQTKYHRELGQNEESEDPIKRFLCNVPNFDKTSDELRSFKSILNNKAAQLFNDAHQKRRDEDYDLLFLFVTTKKVNGLKINRIRKDIKFRKDEDEFVVVQASVISALLQDYLINRASEPPLISFELKNKDYLQVKDKKTKISARVVSIPADQIGKIYDEWGESLFNLNIRGFEGRKTAINKAMTRTLEENAEDFFYLNNGITIVCEELMVSGDEPVILKLSRPQIINGQQTTRAISFSETKGKEANVLVKIVDLSKVKTSEDRLIRRIVKATNSQNRIQLPDLVSNEKNQVEIQQILQKVKYLYQRKRNVRPVTPTGLRADDYMIIKMHEIWKPIAAIYFGPEVTRLGKNVFDLDSEEDEEKYYDAIFNPKEKASFFLVPYWLGRIVTASAQKQEYAFAKWYVLKLFWDLGGKKLLEDKNSNKLFRFGRDYEKNRKEQNDPISKTIEPAVGEVYDLVYKYYKKNRKRTKRGQWQELSTYIRSVNYTATLLPHMKKTGLRSTIAGAIKKFENVKIPDKNSGGEEIKKLGE